MSLPNPTSYLINFSKKITLTITAIMQTQIIKNFFIYACGSFLLKTISFLFLPFVLSIFTPENYGLLSLVTSFTNVFVIFSGFGLRQFFSIEYFHHTGDEYKTIINDIIAIYVCCSAPFFLLLAIHPQIVNNYVFFGQGSIALVWICLAYCFLQFFVELLYQVLTYQCKAFELTLLQLSIALTTIFLNIFFLFVLNLNVLGLILGQFIGLTIGFGVGFYFYFKKSYQAALNHQRSLIQCSYYLKNGLPFIPSMACAWLIASGDKWLLARYSTMYNVGIYSLADTFSSLFQIIVLLPMSNAYLPLLFKKYADNKENIPSIAAWNKKNMYWCMSGAALLITAGYSLGKPILVWVLPSHYHPALHYIWLILMGNIFLMGTYFASTLIQYYKKTYFLATAFCVPALINIVLNCLFIPHFGISGCVWATVIAYVCYFMIIQWYSNKLMAIASKS